MLDLLPAFLELQSPPHSASTAWLSAVPITGYEKHRLAKDATGAPCLLVSVADPAGTGGFSPIVLEHLTVQHAVHCRISQPNGATEHGRFSTIRVTGVDPALYSYFLRVVAPIIVLLGDAPHQAEVVRAIDALIDLFRAIAAPPKKSLQGLWAELFVMACMKNPSPLVAAWHMTPEDRYDFSIGNQRLEVKSSVSRSRRHHFSLEQLVPVFGVEVLIASVLVEQTGDGTSVAELADRVRERIGHNPDLLLHFDRIIALTLGSNWRSARESRFDSEWAKESLAFFDATSIPKPDPVLPTEVSEVRFRADLTRVQTANVEYHRSRGGLFGVVLDR